MSETRSTTATYYFNSYDVGTVWDTDPEKMADGDADTYALANVENSEDTELLDENECDGADLGTISKVEIRAKHYEADSQDPTWVQFSLQPFIVAVGGDATAVANTATAAWCDWVDITNFTTPTKESWSWTDIQNLNVLVQCHTFFVGANKIYCSKIEVRITYDKVIFENFTYTPDAVLTESIKYNTIITGETYGKERRRNKWDSPKRVWGLQFNNASGTKVSGISDFFAGVSGTFSTFSWENPIDTITYTVRFQEGSMKREYIGYDRYNVSLGLTEVL